MASTNEEEDCSRQLEQQHGSLVGRAVSWFAGRTCHRDGPNGVLPNWRCRPLWCRCLWSSLDQCHGRSRMRYPKSWTESSGTPAASGLWRTSRRTGKIWSRLLAATTRRAAAFSCDRLITCDLLYINVCYLCLYTPLSVRYRTISYTGHHCCMCPLRIAPSFFTRFLRECIVRKTCRCHKHDTTNVGACASRVRPMVLVVVSWDPRSHLVASCTSLQLWTRRRLASSYLGCVVRLFVVQQIVPPSCTGVGLVS